MDQVAGRRGLEVARVIWRRRKWLGIVAFVGSFATTAVVAASLPNIYRSTAIVLVERQQVTETFVRPAVTSELETRLQTVSQEVLSRARLEELITRFDLYPEFRRRAPLEEVVEHMRRDIKLELKGADLAGGRGATVAFALTYQGRDPEMVARVTNTVASFYVEENFKARERQATGTAQFLRLQLEGVQRRLNEQERRVSEFRTRHSGELPEQVAANLASLERLNVQLRLNSDNQLRAGERREALAKQLSEADSVGPDATATRLARLQQELAELRSRFTDKYPDVVRVKAEIAALERQLHGGTDARPPREASSPSGSPAPTRLREALNGLDAELRALKADERKLREAIAKYERRVENAPIWEQQVREQARDYEATKELYHSLLKRYEEAQLAESMEQRQKGELFRILDPAIAWKQPVAPNRPRLLLVALGFSLGVAVGAVALGERLDTTIHTLDDLRTLTAIPVLASIPEIVTAADARRRRWRFGLGAVPVLVGLALLAATASHFARGSEQLVRMLSRGQF